MINFNAITKKSNFYISTPINDYILSLINIDIVNINHISDNKYNLLIKINEKDDINKLEDIELLIQSIVLENNKTWFVNNMSDQDIINKYTPCFNSQNNILSIIIHLDYNPKLDGFKDINDLMDNCYNNNNLKNISIKLIGIYIKNNNFYIRWLLRTLEKMDYINENLSDVFEDKYNILENMINKRLEILNNEKEKLSEIYKSKNFERLSESFYLILDKT